MKRFFYQYIFLMFKKKYLKQNMVSSESQKCILYKSIIQI